MRVEKRVIDALLVAIPEKDPRKVLLGVEVKATKKTVTFTGTCGRVLTSITLPNEKPKITSSAILHRDGFRTAATLMERDAEDSGDEGQDDDDSMAEVEDGVDLSVPGKGVARIVRNGVSIELERVERKYPDWKGLIPSSEPTFTIAFNINGLARTLQALEPFCEGRHHTVVMECHVKDKPVIFRPKTDGLDDSKVLVILMPVKIHGPDGDE